MKRRRQAGSLVSDVSQVPRAVGHSAVDLFTIPQVLTTFERGYTEEIFSKTTLSGPTLEFEFSGERNVYVDMRNIYLQVKVSLQSYKHATDKTYAEIADGAVDPACFVNNALHSMFSNCEVSLQGEVIGTSNNLYGHKAYIETELSHPSECKDTWLACQGYSYEIDPSDLAADPAFAARRTKNLLHAWNNFYGRLAVDFFNVDKFMLPGVPVRIKLVRAPTEFCVVVTKDKLNAEARYQLKIESASLFVHKIEVAADQYARLERSLAMRPAIYEYPEIVAKTYLVPKGHNQMIEEDIFNSAPIRRLVVAMNQIPQFTGTHDSNPFHYQKFDLNRVLLYREGQSVGSTPLVLENNTRAYFNTIKALHAQHAGNGVKLEEYGNHFILVFVLTADMEARDDTTRPELTGGRLRLHLEFSKPLENTIEVLLLGERKSVVYIDKNRKVLKNTLFAT